MDSEQHAEDASFLSDSTYEIISQSSFQTSDDSSSERDETRSIASSDDLDVVHNWHANQAEGTPPLFTENDIPNTTTDTQRANTEQHLSVPSLNSSTVNSSISDNTITQSQEKWIHFPKPYYDEKVGLVDVTQRVRNDFHHPQDSSGVVNLRHSLASEDLRIDGTFRVLYDGDPELKTCIFDKLAESLDLSDTASSGHLKLEIEEVSCEYRPEHKNAWHVCSLERIRKILHRPNLVVCTHPDIEHTFSFKVSLRKSKLYRFFGIPTIDICSTTPKSLENLEGLNFVPFNDRAIHFYVRCLPASQVAKQETKFPLDVCSFLNLDSTQLNRNIASLSAGKCDNTSSPAGLLQWFSEAVWCMLMLGLTLLITSYNALVSMLSSTIEKVSIIFHRDLLSGLKASTKATRRKMHTHGPQLLWTTLSLLACFVAIVSMMNFNIQSAMNRDSPSAVPAPSNLPNDATIAIPAASPHVSDTSLILAAKSALIQARSVAIESRKIMLMDRKKSLSKPQSTGFETQKGLQKETRGSSKKGDIILRQQTLPAIVRRIREHHDENQAAPVRKSLQNPSLTQTGEVKTISSTSQALTTVNVENGLISVIPAVEESLSKTERPAYTLLKAEGRRLFLQVSRATRKRDKSAPRVSAMTTFEHECGIEQVNPDLFEVFIHPKLECQSFTLVVYQPRSSDDSGYFEIKNECDVARRLGLTQAWHRLKDTHTRIVDTLEEWEEYFDNLFDNLGQEIPSALHHSGDNFRTRLGSAKAFVDISKQFVGRMRSEAVTRFRSVKRDLKQHLRVDHAMKKLKSHNLTRATSHIQAPPLGKAQKRAKSLTSKLKRRMRRGYLGGSG